MTSADDDNLEKWVVEFRQQWEKHLADWDNPFPTVGDTILLAIKEFGDSFAETLRARLTAIDDHYRAIQVQQKQILREFEDACRLADEQKAPLPDPADVCKQHSVVYPGTMFDLLLVYWQHQAARSPGSAEADYMKFPPDWPPDVVDRAGERWYSQRKLNKGDTFAGCEIREYVASGGFGDVYKVVDPPFVVPRALKTLRGDKLWALSQTQQDRRGQTLFSEAVKLDQLSQNAIFPKVHEADVHDGKHYVVMEFLDGQTLWKRQTSNSPLTLAEICHLGSKVADGLDYAVQLGVIHGDISPKNILVLNGDGNEPKIIDFSAITQRETDPAANTSMPETRMMSSFVGTKGFVAPELIAGNADYSEFSEVFSLAATLFHAITGEAPASISRTGMTEIDDGFDFVSKSIRREINESPKMQALLESLLLLCWRSVSPTPAFRPTLSVFAQQLSNIRMENRSPVTSVWLCEARDAEEVTVSSDGTVVAAWNRNRASRLTLWEASTGRLLAATRLRILCDDDVHQIALSTDGSNVIIRSSRKITFWEWRTNRTEHADLHDSVYSRVEFCPTGRLFASTTFGCIHVFDAHSGKHLIDLASPEADSATAICFDPTGDWIVAGYRSGTVIYWDLSVGIPSHTLQGHTHAVSLIAISADGNVVSTVSHDSWRYWHGPAVPDAWLIGAVRSRRTLEPIANLLALTAEFLIYADERYDRTRLHILSNISEDMALECIGALAASASRNSETVALVTLESLDIFPTLRHDIKNNLSAHPTRLERGCRGHRVPRHVVQIPTHLCWSRDQRAIVMIFKEVDSVRGVGSLRYSFWRFDKQVPIVGILDFTGIAAASFFDLELLLLDGSGIAMFKCSGPAAFAAVWNLADNTCRWHWQGAKVSQCLTPSTPATTGEALLSEDTGIALLPLGPLPRFPDLSPQLSSYDKHLMQSFAMSCDASVIATVAVGPQICVWDGVTGALTAQIAIEPEFAQNTQIEWLQQELDLTLRIAQERNDNDLFVRAHEYDKQLKAAHARPAPQSVWRDCSIHIKLNSSGDRMAITQLLHFHSKTTFMQKDGGQWTEGDTYEDSELNNTFDSFVCDDFSHLVANHSGSVSVWPCRTDDDLKGILPGVRYWKMGGIVEVSRDASRVLDADQRSVSISTAGEEPTLATWPRSGLWDVTDAGPAPRLSPDGRFVAEADDDGSVRIMAVDFIRKVCSLYHFVDGSWAVITSSGHYDSPGGEPPSQLKWYSDDGLLSSDAVRTELHRKNLIRDLL